MYNKNFTIPDGQIQLEKLFKLFTVIYNAARDFEVATQSKQPRPRIDFKVNQVNNFMFYYNFYLFWSSLHWLLQELNIHVSQFS